MQGVDKKRRKQSAAIIVCSPQTLLDKGKELKVKKIFLSAPEGCLKMHKRKKNRQENIRGSNKIMN